jgi:hypothetical protein
VYAAPASIACVTAYLLDVLHECGAARRVSPMGAWKAYTRTLYTQSY